MEKNYKLTLAYDGTRFFGWEHQPDKETIQGKLETVLERPFSMDTKNEGMGLEQNLALFVLKIRTKSAKNVTLLLNFRQKRHFFSERKKRAFSRGKVDTFSFLTYNYVKQSGLRATLLFL